MKDGEMRFLLVITLAILMATSLTGCLTARDPAGFGGAMERCRQSQDGIGPVGMMLPVLACR